MSLGTCIKYGAGMGLSGGIIAGTYYHEEAKRYERYEDSILSMFFRGMSAGAIVTGPFIGMGAGVALYGAKRATILLVHAQPSTQKVAFAVAVTGIAAVYVKNRE
jgi:hypothetical protein